MKKEKIRRGICVAVLSTLGAWMASAQASGFRIPEVSTAGLGTANALVANPEELGALPYNPAAMGFHDYTAVEAGLSVVFPTTTVKNSAGSNDSEADTPFLIPNFYLTAPAGNNWFVGLSINAPFGLETKYEPGTFPGFGGSASAAPTTSALKMVNINPNAAVKLGANTSFAFGLDYYKIDDLKFDTVGSKTRGDGADWGWNAAFLHSAGSWSIGASYRSKVKVDIDGYTSTSTGTIGAKTELEFPAMAQIGARFKATEKMAVEFDYEWTDWKSFDTLTIEATTSVPPLGISPGTVLVNSANDWTSSSAYRIGVTYALSQKTQLRFGYALDETPQPDKNFTARIPDADRQLLSFGVKQDVGDGWDWEGGVMYVLWDDRKINSSTALSGGPIPAPDPNGTSAFNGKYESDAWLIGLGVGKKF